MATKTKTKLPQWIKDSNDHYLHGAERADELHRKLLDERDETNKSIREALDEINDLKSDNSISDNEAATRISHVRATIDERLKPRWQRLHTQGIRAHSEYERIKEATNDGVACDQSAALWVVDKLTELMPEYTVYNCLDWNLEIPASAPMTVLVAAVNDPERIYEDGWFPKSAVEGSGLEVVPGSHVAPNHVLRSYSGTGDYPVKVRKYTGWSSAAISLRARRHPAPPMFDPGHNGILEQIGWEDRVKGRDGLFHTTDSARNIKKRLGKDAVVEDTQHVVLPINVWTSELEAFTGK